MRYRVVGQRSYQVLRRDLAASTTFSVSPAELPPGQDVEYLLQLTDQHGSALLEVGTELAPLRARAAAPPAVTADNGSAGRRTASTTAHDETAGVLTQPWLWIAAGAGAVALLAGGATAAAVAWIATEPKQAHFGQVRPVYNVLKL